MNPPSWALFAHDLAVALVSGCMEEKDARSMRHHFPCSTFARYTLLVVRYTLLVSYMHATPAAPLNNAANVLRRRSSHTQTACVGGWVFEKGMHWSQHARRRNGKQLMAVTWVHSTNRALPALAVNQSREQGAGAVPVTSLAPPAGR